MSLDLLSPDLSHGVQEDAGPEVGFVLLPAHHPQQPHRKDVAVVAAVAGHQAKPQVHQVRPVQGTEY